jgi:hypothetical protein
MILWSYKKKLTYVFSLLPPASVENCELLLQQELALDPKKSSLFTLHILFLLLKHKIWRDNPLFIHIAIYHLGKEYQQAQQVCQKALALVSGEIYRQGASCKPLPQAYSLDKNFLFYLVAMTLSSTHERELQEDMGLGTEILQVIKNATLQSDQKLVNFDSLLSQQCTSIIQEVAEEYQRTPWVSDVLILMFSLYNAPEPYQSWDVKILSHSLFDGLLWLGKQKTAALGLFINELSSRLTRSGSVLLNENNIIELIDYLTQLDFIYKIPHAHPKKSLLALTEHGYQLTAQAFSVQHQQHPDVFWGKKFEYSRIDL